MRPGSSTTPSYPQLPPGFVLGTATAAYQIEGGWDEDGKGPSVWDTFTRQEDAVRDGGTGQVACDHYHRWEEDVALIRDLGAPGYRFSVAWPRVMPTGRDAVNEAGLDFYDRLVDALLQAGIAPMVTLYHWDLPQALQDDGGWLNRETVHRFGEYASVVADRLGDRVAQWVPVNEPNVVTMLGHARGTHAPGLRLLFDALPVAHHLLLGHGTAIQAIRASGATGEIGCANNHAPIWPASDDPAHVGASKLFDALWNGLFVEPMLLGRPPADLAPLLADLAKPGDLATVRQPLDFYGVNYYQPLKVAAAPEGAEMPFELLDVLGHDTTDFGSPVVPDALQELLIQLRARYRAALPPIVITEAGASYATGPDEDGVVDDQERIDYLDQHLRAVAVAVRQGVDVRGFYTRSLLDDFEWGEGYTQRFGLVHVDHETQRRTPKRSFEWYRALVAAQPAND